MEKGLRIEKEISIFKKGEGRYREYRIPGILPISDGTLLLTCEARAEDRGDWGDIDIIVCRMRKNGDVQQVLKIGQSNLPADGTMRTYNNPVLVPDGERVHLIYHRNYEQAFICSSEDGGRMWSTSREITNCYRSFPFIWNVCATGPGHGIQLRTGRLVAAIWLANGEVSADGKTRRHWPSVAGCIYSDDHGQTWKAGALANDMKDGNETTVAQLPDGRLLFNCRNREENHYRGLGISENGEKLDSLWTCTQMEDPWCFGGSASTEKGIIFGNCESKSQRIDATVKYSTDAGKTWNAIMRVDENAGYIDIAYSEQRVYAFYEKSSPEENIIQELVLKVSEKVIL